MPKKTISILAITTALFLLVSNITSANFTSYFSDKNFTQSDTFSLLQKRVDLLSFLGKPVKIPMSSANPDGVPGGDLDYLYIIPPQFFLDPKTGIINSIPTQAFYFSSGNKITAEQKSLLQDGVEIVLNQSLAGRELLTQELKNTLLLAVEQNAALRKVSFWQTIKGFFVSANEAKAADKISGGDAAYADTDLKKILNAKDARVDQMVNLLLLNLIYGDTVAQAANVDKEACLTLQGEWMADGTCALNETQSDAPAKQDTCHSSGGTWGRAFSYREICKAKCGMTNEDCSKEMRNAPSDAFGCICPPDQCLGADGKCVTTDANLRDGDGDGVSNARDLCPNSATGEFTGPEGCSCKDHEKQGQLQERKCPASTCEENYFTDYPATGKDTCVNGIITQHSCSPITRQINTDCQKKYLDQQTQQAQDDASDTANPNKKLRNVTSDLGASKTFVAAKRVYRGIPSTLPGSLARNIQYSGIPGSKSQSSLNSQSFLNSAQQSFWGAYGSAKNYAGNIWGKLTTGSTPSDLRTNERLGEIMKDTSKQYGDAIKMSGDTNKARQLLNDYGDVKQSLMPFDPSKDPAGGYTSWLEGKKSSPGTMPDGSKMPDGTQTRGNTAGTSNAAGGGGGAGSTDTGESDPSASASGGDAGPQPFDPYTGEGGSSGGFGGGVDSIMDDPFFAKNVLALPEGMRPLKQGENEEEGDPKANPTPPGGTDDPTTGKSK